MSEVYTPDPTNNPVSITIPEDGDDKPVASILVAVEGLADKAAHANWPEQDDSKTYPLASQTILRVQAGQPVGYDVNTETPVTPGWGFNAQWVQLTTTGTSAGEILRVNFDPPHGAILQFVTVWLAGKTATGHASLPALPFMRVFAYDHTTDVSTPLCAVTTDPSPDVASYDAPHPILLTCGATVDRVNKSYFMNLKGESGGAAVPGLRLLAAIAHYLITGIDKGAA